MLANYNKWHYLTNDSVKILINKEVNTDMKKNFKEVFVSLPKNIFYIIDFKNKIIYISMEGH